MINTCSVPINFVHATQHEYKEDGAKIWRVIDRSSANPNLHYAEKQLEHRWVLDSLNPFAQLLMLSSLGEKGKVRTVVDFIFLHR